MALSTACHTRGRAERHRPEPGVLVCVCPSVFQVLHAHTPSLQQNGAVSKLREGIAGPGRISLQWPIQQAIHPSQRSRIGVACVTEMTEHIFRADSPHATPGQRDQSSNHMSGGAWRCTEVETILSLPFSTSLAHLKISG